MQKCNQGIQNKYWTKLRFDQVSKDLTDLTWSKQSQHCGANNVDLTFFGEKFNIKKDSSSQPSDLYDCCWRKNIKTEEKMKANIKIDLSKI